MITIVDPFRPFIFKTKFDFSKLEIFNRLDETILQFNDPELYERNFQTTNHTAQPHTWTSFAQYLDFVNTTVDKIWEISQFADLQKFVTSSHLNQYTKDYALREHAHPGVDLVITGYIKKPKESGNIEVRNPLEYQWHTLPINGHPDEAWREIPIEENDVLIFPGWLYHRTQKSKTEDPRITISMMIKTRLAQNI
jgi:uncharacterized protein (TIGR02466 family)